MLAGAPRIPVLICPVLAVIHGICPKAAGGLWHAHHETSGVAVIPLHLQIDISIAGLYGIHDLPEILGFPDVCPKRCTDLRNLVPNLHK